MTGEGIYAKVDAAFRNMTDQPHLGEALGGPLPPEPALPGESTSAALRRVEQERAEALASLKQMGELRAEVVEALRGMRSERDEAIEERNEIVRAKARMQRDLDAELAEAREQLAVATIAARKVAVAQKECDDLRADHNAALAELASARTELEQLRGARTYGPGATVRTRDADGNDHQLLIGDNGRPATHKLGAPPHA